MRERTCLLQLVSYLSGNDEVTPSWQWDVGFGDKTIAVDSFHHLRRSLVHRLEASKSFGHSELLSRQLSSELAWCATVWLVLVYFLFSVFRESKEAGGTRSGRIAAVQMSLCWWLTNSSLASFFKHTTVVCSKLKPRDQASLAQILMLTLQNQSAFLKAFHNSFMTEALHCLSAVSDVPYKYVISQ